MGEFESEFGVYVRKVGGWGRLPEEIEKKKGGYGLQDTVGGDPGDDGLV
ncbi:hypothetical protein [Staphylococcus capitis]|nr:hypothetical protein [Staphylococcus capitis]